MNQTPTEPDMIKRQTIAAMLTTTAIAFSIATPAQAARLLEAGPFDTVSACSGDKPATATPGERKDKPAQT